MFSIFDGVCEVFKEVDGPGRLLNDEEGPGWASLDVDNLDWLVSSVDVILGLLLLIGVFPFDALLRRLLDIRNDSHKRC